jgi:NAD(P)-dependent dehydrogenase (short-subunit alcohol dehydrogenase family)
MGQLDGKVALITGSGRGQGLKAAEAFAREGAKLVINDLDEESVEAAVSGIIDAGGEATGAVGDVSDPESVQKVLKAAKDEFGGLDILYNNAGIGYSATARFGVEMSDIVNTSVEDYRRVVDINLGGVFFFCKWGIPMLIERGGGSVINTASVAAVRGGPAAHAYTATKGAIVALTRSIAVTYGPQGVRANAILPGAIDTEMIHSRMVADESVAAAIIQSTPLRRFGQPEDIADVAVFLASDAARFVTAQPVIVDGGWVS